MPWKSRNIEPLRNGSSGAELAYILSPIQQRQKRQKVKVVCVLLYCVFVTIYVSTARLLMTIPAPWKKLSCELFPIFDRRLASRFDL